MKRAYRWRCFACDGANAAAATTCSACGFPATATAAEIDRGRAARRSGLAPASILERPSAGEPARPPARWTGARKGIAIGGAALLALGAYAGMDTLSWRGVGVSVFALMFGFLLLTFAWAGRNAATAA